MEDAVHDALLQSACTGQIGDGKIFVLDLHSATRIRTGEKKITHFNLLRDTIQLKRHYFFQNLNVFFNNFKVVFII